MIPNKEALIPDRVQILTNRFVGTYIGDSLLLVLRSWFFRSILLPTPSHAVDPAGYHAGTTEVAHAVTPWSRGVREIALVDIGFFSIVYVKMCSNQKLS